MPTNQKDDVCYAQPRTLEQRLAIARDFVKRNDYTIPMLVDRMENTADGLYAGWKLVHGARAGDVTVSKE